MLGSPALEKAPAPPAPPGAAAESKRRDAPAPAPSRRILGLRVDATRYDAAARSILERGRSGVGGTVCVATVHMVMEGVDDWSFRRLVNAADLVTPDGVPLVWALRWLGVPGATRVYGPTLTELLCRRAAAEGLPVGFYGGSPEVLEALVERLVDRHPGLQVTFRMSPPFRPLEPGEEAEVDRAILDSGCRVLFVGLGCPKQERWMAAHRAALPCALVGVGAAFDFLSGAKHQAPRWMQSAGLEWLFRLLQEPRRLWRRYLLYNPRFALGLALQLVLDRRAPS